MSNSPTPLGPALRRQDADRSAISATPVVAIGGRVAALAGPPPRVAVVDRDSGFLAVLAKRLDPSDWEHEVLSSPPSLELIEALNLNAVIVDRAVLGDRFWEWLEQVSSLSPSVAIVVCTRGSTVAHRVRALRLGADDWLAKPCHPDELIARVDAVLRHQRRIDEADRDPIVAGELEIQASVYQVFARGRDVKLTRREFEVIELLASHEGCALERGFIYESLWGYPMNRGDRSVDVFIRKIRQKLEVASPEWQYIHTQFRLGYSFSAVPDQAAVPREAVAAA